ncbi:hypothetical protein Pd630_LPD04704 [Rhodococcus opacus PD630]|nr:hypothetical protein Pd630_LPD04704 [Rhodococcus opacus PD630]
MLPTDQLGGAATAANPAEHHVIANVDECSASNQTHWAHHQWMGSFAATVVGGYCGGRSTTPLACAWR